MRLKKMSGRWPLQTALESVSSQSLLSGRSGNLREPSSSRVPFFCHVQNDQNELVDVVDVWFVDWYPDIPISQDPDLFCQLYQLHYHLQLHSENTKSHQMPGAMLNIGPTRPIMLGGFQIQMWGTVSRFAGEYLSPQVSSNSWIQSHLISKKMVKGGGCDWMFPWLKRCFRI